MRTRNQMWVPVGISSLILLVAGCSSSKTKPTNENFIAGLNAYYANHDDCLFPSAPRFPYEVSPGSDAAEDKMRMEALLKASMVEKKEDKSIHVSVYSLTPVGARFGPRFCYGHRNVTSIDSSTPPTKNNGLLETQVTYHYTMMDVPVWAKTAEMQKAFPALEKALSGQATAQAKLANAGVGWQVPN
jgi:hypothetical protein